MGMGRDGAGRAVGGQGCCGERGGPERKNGSDESWAGSEVEGLALSARGGREEGWSLRIGDGGVDEGTSLEEGIPFRFSSPSAFWPHMTSGWR